MSIIPRTRASWCYYVDSKQRQCTRLITTQASSCAEHARARTWLSQATWRILLWLIVFSGLRPGHQRPARLLCWFISCTPRGRRASPQPCWAITPKQKAQMSTKTTPQWALQNHLQHRPSLLSTCSLGLQVTLRWYFVQTWACKLLYSCCQPRTDIPATRLKPPHIEMSFHIWIQPLSRTRATSTLALRDLLWWSWLLHHCSVEPLIKIMWASLTHKPKKSQHAET